MQGKSRPSFASAPLLRAATGAALCAALGLALLSGCAGGPKPGAQPPKETAPAQPGKSAEQKKMDALSDAAALLDKGDTEAAVAKLDALAAAEPQNSDIKMLKASALVSAGRTKDARSLLDEVIAADPSNPKALSLAADLARFDGDEKARKSYLDRGLAAAPSDSGILVAWGQYQLDQKNWAKAEDFYRKAQAADAKNPDAPLGLGDSLYREAKYPEAEAALDAALALDPSSPFAYSSRSKVRYQRGEYKEALADLDAAIAKAPDFSWLYLDRGRMKLDSGDRKGADEDLSACIKLEPDYFLPYVYRAGLYEQTGRDAEALADYEKIIALNPSYWYAWESRGAAAFRLGAWDKSAESFRKAYGYARDRYEYAIIAAIALMRGGKASEAKAWAASVAPTVDREKNNSYWLALRLLQDQNDQTTELEIGIQTEKKLDDKAAMLFYLGEYWYAKGRTELAAKYLGLARDQRREDCLEYRLLVPELKRLEAAGVRP